MISFDTNQETEMEKQWKISDANLEKFEGKTLRVVSKEGSMRRGANIILADGCKIGVAFPIVQAMGNFNDAPNSVILRQKGYIEYTPVRKLLKRSGSNHFWLEF